MSERDTLLAQVRPKWEWLPFWWQIKLAKQFRVSLMRLEDMPDSALRQIRRRLG